MKNIIYLSIVLLVFACKKQNSQASQYQIIGNIDSMPNNSIVYIRNMDFVDSTIVNDGKYRFEGKPESPTQDFLSVKSVSGRRALWLESETITVSGTFDDIEKLSVIGSKNQRISNLLWNKKKPILEELKKSSNLISSTSDSIFNKDSLAAHIKSLSSQLVQIERNFLKENINTLDASIILNKYKRTWNKDTVKNLFSLMGPEAQYTASGIEIKRFLDLSKNPQVGDHYIDFTGQDAEDEEVSLSQFLGKYTLVDFWASYCAPCREENPNLVNLFNSFQQDGFKVVGVSLDMKKDNWLKAIDQDGLPWDHIILKNPDSDAAYIYDIRGIPDNLLLDEKGVILARGLTGDFLQKELDKLFRDNNLNRQEKK